MSPTILKYVYFRCWFQGLEAVCDIKDDNKELAKINDECRKWVRENVHKDLREEQHGGGRRQKTITKHKYYHIMKLWEDAIIFKFRSYLEAEGSSFSEETWKKWKLRFLRNWDETNSLFLKAITLLQVGDILYVTEPNVQFVSYSFRIIFVSSVVFGYIYPIRYSAGYSPSLSRDRLLGRHARLLAGRHSARL